MARASTFGRMEGSLTVSGITIKCMEKVFLLGQMVVNMKELIKMIRSMGSEFSPLEMAECMKDNGRTENSMDVEYTERKKSLEKAFGKMELE